MDIDAMRQALSDERERLSQLKARLDDEQSAEEELSTGRTELTVVDQHPADDATETFERERTSSIADTVADHLKEVEDALDRIDRGVFGRCESCGRDISEERLASRPSARYCLDDQQRVEQGARS